jgi:hypothetical protein
MSNAVIQGINNDTGRAQPFVVDPTGRSRTIDESLPPGGDTVLDRTWGGMLVEAVRVTADAQVVAGACAVVGFSCTAGTNPRLALYNGTTTSDTLVYGGATDETINAPKAIAGGAAVYCPLGLYADISGTSSPAFTVYVVRQ